MKKFKDRIIKIIQLFITIALICVLLYFIDWNKFLITIKTAKILYVVIAGFLFFPGILFSVFRWNSILEKLKIIVSKKNLARLYLEGSFLGNFLPTSVGGDIYKYAILDKQFPNQKKNVISSMLLERGSGFLILFAVNILLLPFFIKIIFSDSVYASLEMFILLGLFFILTLFFFSKYIHILIKKLPFKLPLYDKLYNFLLNIKQTFDRKIVIITSVYSFLFVINILAGQIFYLKAFGVFVNPLYLLFAISIIYIIGVLPISLNSIGITEGLTVFLYGFIGISPEIALAVALSGRVCLLIANLSGGLVLLLNRTPIKTME